MSKPKHTPGRWVWNGSFDGGCNIQMRGGSYFIAKVPWYGDTERTVANARLIAEAPAMYEALRAIVTHPSYAEMEDGETGEPCNLIAAARAILARIEGENE